MSICLPYNESQDAAGSTGPCNTWPVYSLNQGIAESLTIVVTDTKLADIEMISSNYVPICGESIPTEAIEGFGEDCLVEGAEFRFRDNWTSGVVRIIEGVRVDENTFQFDFSADVLVYGGLFLGEIILYQPVDGRQKAVWIKHVYLEVASNSLGLCEQASLSIADLRLIMRDECPGSNFLLDDLEYTDKEIFSALRRCVDYWNETPPPIGKFDYNNFPYRYHWGLGAMGQLMRSVAMHKLRNFLNHDGGGMAINDQARWTNYQQLGNQYWDEYREWVLSKKVEINIEGGFGSI